MVRPDDYRLKRIEVLDFIRKREVVGAYDLVTEFGYKYYGARRRLANLVKMELVKRIGKGEYCLTEKGYERLEYYSKLSERS